MEDERTRSMTLVVKSPHKECLETFNDFFVFLKCSLVSF